MEIGAADKSRETVEYVARILKEERDIVITSKPLEVSRFQVEYIKMADVFYESGLAINVMYAVDDPKKLAGTIRGSFFVIKKEY